MKKLAIIADDLTGAMDAGIQLAMKKYRVCVVTNEIDIQKVKNNTDILVFDTETRNIEVHAAIEKLIVCIQAIKRHGFKLIYKKIDSTLRGNIGGEINTVLKYSDTELILFAPALPYSGRTTLKGHQYVNGILLAETETACDFLSPVTYSSIADIIKLQTDEKAVLIDMGTIRSGRKNVISKMKEFYEYGYKIIVLDAEDESDLRTIALSAYESPLQKMLLCGSGGLLEKMQIDLQTDKIADKSHWGIKRNKNEQPFILVVSCSSSKVTSEQIEEAGSCKDVAIVKLDVQSLLSSKQQRMQEISGLEQRLPVLINNGMAIVICIQRLSAKIMDKDSVAENSLIIRETVEELLVKACFIKKPGGMVVVGGDTLLSVFNSLDAFGIEIKQEIEPYMPLGIMLSKHLGSIPVITKAGGFGNKYSILKAIQYLFELNL